VNKTLQIVLVSFLLVGCAAPVKQSWYNFTAYYNTFYNTKQFYSEGVSLNERQTPEMNPAQPIRIHKTPTQAGREQFQEAIERGASILRNHENSKYVNPAIFIIGKSYFYRSEFFSALEKFQELQQVSTGTEQQQSILWQGRTYLEMTSIDEGIRFLELELDYIEEWDSNLKAEVYSVLAQLYSEQRDWSKASEYLHLASSDLGNRHYQARAYFLHGQILERLQNNNQALVAYRLASQIRTDYNFEFNALRKQAELARRLGDYDTALRLFRSIERDDKFLEYHLYMRYEIAKTHQERGDAEQSLQLYRDLLTDRFNVPDNTTRALVYFGLGEIFRDDFDNFALAAAYFDSASAIQVDQTQLTSRFNATELALSFGEYASLKREINRADSLLHLASLEPEKLDSVIAIIQERMAMEAEVEAGRSQRRTPAMRSATVTDSVVDAIEIAEYGFLNVRSQNLLTDASLQFQAVWGDRPLKDNWRRRADVSGSRFDRIVLSDEETTVNEVASQNGNGMIMPGPDLSDIPFSEVEKQEMKRNRENFQYRLANLFFLSLDMPDSARVYYQKVVDGNIDSSLSPRSLYSLADLELIDGNNEQAEAWANQLITGFPESIYAERVAERLGKSHSRAQPDEQVGTEKRFFEIINSDSSLVNRAAKLQKLANETSRENQKPLILFEAARLYLQAAILESDNPLILTNWLKEQEELEKQRMEFQSIQDSARIKLDDRLELTEEEIAYWESVADSNFVDNGVNSPFPFEGAFWDSTRSILAEIESNYASSSIIPAVQTLKQTIGKPEGESPGNGFVVEEFPRDRFPTEPAPEPDKCLEIGFELEEGMEAFLRRVNYPDWTREVNMRGEITYRLDIDPDGNIESFEQVSRMDRSGIPQAFEAAIQKYLKFKPGVFQQVARCNITFPIEI
jgi:tetratricopeptide (TPR) repeat protein